MICSAKTEARQVGTAVDSLEGQALAWACIIALGKTPLRTGPGQYGYRSDHGSIVTIHVNRGEAADLVAEEWISVDRPCNGQNPSVFRCVADYKGKQKPFRPTLVVSAHATRFEVAVFRCFIKSRQGNFVDVSRELVEAAAPH